MKIAIGIFVYFPWGGLQYDMLNIAQELARRGADVTIFTGEWKGREYPENIKVELLSVSGVSNHARALDFARKFHAASEGADVKFAFSRFGGCDYYFAADDCFASSLTGRKGGFLLRHFGRYKVFSRLEEEIFTPGSSTHIFYIAQKQIQEFQSVYNTPSERFTFLGPGIKPCFVPPESSVRQESRKYLGAGEDDLVCLFVAANWRLKGGDRIMESFIRLPEALRSRMQLHFLGGDGKGDARRLAERLGITDRCVFHGTRQDVEYFLAGADVLLHPARKEAAGNVIAEALGCGVPVILTEICGYASLVETSGAGIVLSDPFEERTFASAIENWASGKDSFRKRALAAANELELHSRASAAADLIFERHSF